MILVLCILMTKEYTITNITRATMSLNHINPESNESVRPSHVEFLVRIRIQMFARSFSTDPFDDEFLAVGVNTAWPSSKLKTLTV